MRDSSRPGWNLAGTSPFASHRSSPTRRKSAQTHRTTEKPAYSAVFSSVLWVLPTSTFGFPRSRWPFLAERPHTVVINEGFPPFGGKRQVQRLALSLLSPFVAKTAKTTTNRVNYRKPCLFSRPFLRLLDSTQSSPLASLTHRTASQIGQQSPICSFREHAPVFTGAFKQSPSDTFGRLRSSPTSVGSSSSRPSTAALILHSPA